MHKEGGCNGDDSRDQFHPGDTGSHQALPVSHQLKLEAKSVGDDSQEAPQKVSGFVLLVIMLLSTTEGFNMGYLNGLMDIFREEGVSSDQIGLLTFINFPFLLCFLGGPIVDRYYSNKFGKRRTYLLPSKIVASLAYAGFSLYIDQAVADKQISLITWVLVAIGSIQFFDFNALLGLRYEVFGPKGSGMASFTLFAGILIGEFFGFTMFVLLNSKYFCQDLLGLKSERLFTHQMLLILYSVLSLIAGLLTLGVKEKPCHRNVASPNERSMNTYTMIRIMLCDPVVKRATLWVLYSGYALACIKASIPQMLIHKGMRREHIVIMDGLIVVPFMIFGNWLLNKYIVIGKIMRSCCILMILYLGSCFIDLANVLTFDSDSRYELGLALYLFSNMCTGFLPYMSYQIAFVNSISHPEHAASFATTMLGLMNFGKVIPITIAVSMLDFVPFTALFLILTISNMLILFLTYNNIVRQIDDATLDEYHAGIDKYTHGSTKNKESLIAKSEELLSQVSPSDRRA